MPGDVRASLTLSGRHSLEPDGAREACAALGQALSGSPATYKIYCLGKEHSEGGEKAPEGIVIDVDRMTYDAFWGARSSFRVPNAMVDAVTRCLGASGELGVRASACIERMPITLPTIGCGSMGESVSAMMFGLPSPKSARENPDHGEASFSGMATPSDRDKASITFFGECTSGTADAHRAAEHVLGALSGYCEAAER